LASCLIELARYGEADETLTALSTETFSPDILERAVAFVAEKDEYKRAEAALVEMLKLDAEHAPSRFRLDELRALKEDVRRIDCGATTENTPLQVDIIPLLHGEPQITECATGVPGALLYKRRASIV
jgi:hypothetical protein